MNVHAAGLALVCPEDGVVLCVRRGPASDHAGTWCPPGGGIERGETARQAALREATEELRTAARRLQGTQPVGRVVASNGFITFVDLVSKEWKRKLGPLEPDGRECDDIAWLPIDALPDELHPGFREVLTQKIVASEMDVGGRPTGPGVGYGPDRSNETARFSGPNPGILLQDLGPWAGRSLGAQLRAAHNMRGCR